MNIPGLILILFALALGWLILWLALRPSGRVFAVGCVGLLLVAAVLGTGLYFLSRPGQ